MKIEYRPYQLNQMSTYCTGSTTKKLAASASWSPRRVYVRLMNSRKAKNDTNRNSTITPVLPSRNATPIVSTITHQARMRALRLSIVPCGRPGTARCLRMKPTTEASTRMVATPAKMAKVCCGDVIERLLARRRHHGEQCVAAALQERGLLFGGSEAQGGADEQRTKQRHGNESPFGHDASRVLDPNGNEIDVRAGAREMVYPALEREERRFGRIACSLREDNERVARFDRFDHRRDRVLGARRARSIDQHGVDETGRNRAADARLAPII